MRSIAIIVALALGTIVGCSDFPKLYCDTDTECPDGTTCQNRQCEREVVLTCAQLGCPEETQCVDDVCMEIQTHPYFTAASATVIDGPPYRVEIRVALSIPAYIVVYSRGQFDINWTGLDSTFGPEMNYHDVFPAAPRWRVETRNALNEVTARWEGDIVIPESNQLCTDPATSIIRPNGFICRPSVGTCDSLERCDGISPHCPSEHYLDAGLTCIIPPGGEGTCDGVSPACNNPPHLGEVCQFASDCASGYCVDGVCCNGPCQGSCASCTASQRRGECALYINVDPQNECAGASVCNGWGGCTP